MIQTRFFVVLTLFLTLIALPSCKVTKQLDFKRAIEVGGGTLSAVPDSDRCTAMTAVSPDDPTKLDIKLSCGITVLGPDLTAIGGGQTVIFGATSGGRSTHNILPGFKLKNGYTVVSASLITGRDEGVQGGSNSSLPAEGSDSPATSIRLWVDAMPRFAIGQGVQSTNNGGSLRITISGPSEKDPYQ